MLQRRATRMASNSKRGYEWQAEQTTRIIDASAGSKNIRHHDSRGRPITSADDLTHGADDGIDLVTTFSGKNKQAKSRARNFFESNMRKFDGK